jgi:class 3 adenylate cyclase/tetratricopeptide (TPR) repeat protein
LCEQCASPLPEGARFCPSCGAPQGALADIAGAEERRVVTVLFADVVGFTALAEGRDPEQVKRLVDAAFELLVRDVESYGGVVDKLLGDGIVALFGAPVAHEDDADRAVLAGITMQRTLATFRDEHPADDLRMRVGINTGEVLVGTLAGTDYTAMGDVVNTAARLQTIAPADGVLVGAETKSLCSPAIRFQEVDPIQLRGRVGATTAWQVVAVDRARPRRRWASDVSFVGRRAELAVLGAVIATVEAGRGAIVAVSGEAGIGKSRLVSEAIAPLVAARPDALLLEGSCAPYGESNVWWPVAGGVLEHLGLDRVVEEPDLRERVVEKLTPFEELQPGTPQFDRFVEFVLHLLGRPSALDALGPVAMRDAVVGGMVAGLRLRAEKAPVIIWVDDVQWAAPVLLELLESVARQLAGLPVLIATTFRPDGDVTEGWPPAADPAMSLHLSLEPLPEGEATELVRRAAGRDLGPGVISAISTRSGGNPLFLIELARLAATRETEDATELPGSLRALIAAQLDRLSLAEREIIDNAAIIGNEGRAGALRRFAEHLGQTYDPEAFAHLTDSGLLVRDLRGWRFRSDVVREVAYQTLTKQVRAQRHAGVAMYLHEYEPGAIDRRAHHMATAAELVAELGPIDGVPADAAELAVEWLGQAGQAWQRQGAARRGLDVTERALRLAPRWGSTSRNLGLLQIELLVDLHRHAEARELIAEMVPQAELAADHVVSAELARLLGRIEQMDGDLVAARRELSKAVEAFRSIGDDAHLADALRARGFAEVFGGSLAEAERYLIEAEELFERVDDPRGRAWVQQNLAWVSFLSGDHVVSERRLRAAIDAFDEIDDRGGRAWSLGLLAYVYHFGRRNVDALRLAEAALTDAKQWGDAWGTSMMRNLKASVLLWRGEIAEAHELAERALAGFRKIDDRFGQIQALGTLNRALVALGRFADADRTVEETMVLSGAFGELAYPGIAAAGTAMHVGRGSEAVRRASEAVGRLDTTGANVDEGRVIGAFGRILTGDPEAALAELLAVDVERSPFALAARATAAALVGDDAQAREDADRVLTMGEVSYWDRAIALAAGYAAACDDREARRAQLIAAVGGIGDVMITAYVERLLGRVAVSVVDGAAGDGPTSRIVDLGGWADVADQLAARTAPA